MLYLGIDTSNYTTSAALYDSENGTVVQQKMPLPVKKGARGLRQSDAVFHHTVQLPQVLEKLLSGDPCIWTVSVFPYFRAVRKAPYALLFGRKIRRKGCRSCRCDPLL